MKELSLGELIDLTVADVPDVEVRLEKLFEWHIARSTEIAKWVLGLAASLLIAFLAALFSEKVKVKPYQTILWCVGAALTGAYGIVLLWRTKKVSRQFVAALRLACELRGIRQFLVYSRQQRAR